ncbi:DUF2752 domain-containing protein [Micromonospora sp. NPDC049523]|uniref:DUF2752 domain-containing protein n=1 Tax=Micromonospora sp. NPDC049523 TaxID=3155921 RepID=UPI0034268027
MRRELSVPERLGLFGLSVAPVAAVWPWLTDSTGLGTPCPLRWLTGVPCPGCGLTTAAVALVHGDVGGAFRANPVIFGLAALAVAVGPVLGLRAVGVLSAPVAWSARARRRMGRGVVLLALASWVFQLIRLGVG